MATFLFMSVGMVVLISRMFWRMAREGRALSHYEMFGQEYRKNRAFVVICLIAFVTLLSVAAAIKPTIDLLSAWYAAFSG